MMKPSGRYYIQSNFYMISLQLLIQLSLLHIQMTLQLIVEEIKLIGNLKATKINVNHSGEQEVLDQRRFRVKIGEELFISKQYGHFVSPNQLYFNEPFSYLYENGTHLIEIEVFTQHQYLNNSDLDQILTAQIDLSDLTSLNGNYIESILYDLRREQVGKIILAIETFKKGQKYTEKVSSKIFFQAVKDERQKQIYASEAAKNIKNLLVNNTIPDTLMTISAMTVICDKQDPDIFMRQGFIMIRYGLTTKAFSSMIKIANKQNANWTDYLEFMKNDGVKFQFYFFHYDELGNLFCKAKGQIKYIVFDETINLHTITLFDKRSNKYAALMVKFNEKQVDKVAINNKIDKKVAAVEPLITSLIEQFNRFKFQNKNNNHILSEKQWELEQQAQAQEEEKQRPMNPQQKKKQEEHSRFIAFLQKEMIKIQRQLTKREKSYKKDDRKSMFLPTIEKKGVNEQRYQKASNKMNSSFSVPQFQGLKLPKI